MVLSNLSDALVALGRISKFLTAEELAEPHYIDYERKNAVEVDGDFTWETAGKLEEGKFSVIRGGGGGHGHGGRKIDKVKSETGRKSKMGKHEGLALPTTVDVGSNLGSDIAEAKSKEAEQEKPFELKNLNIKITKGAFVAIVGRVGSGKVRPDNPL